MKTREFRGHKIITDYKRNRRVYRQREAEPIGQEIVARQQEKSGDCVGRWTCFAFGPVILLVQA